MTEALTDRSEQGIRKQASTCFLVAMLGVGFSQPAFSDPMIVDTSLRTNFSDNIEKERNKKSDVEYDASITLGKSDRVGKFDYSTVADLRYLYYQRGGLDNTFEPSLDFNGDYHISPNQLLWNVSNNLTQVSSDTTASDTSDNRERQNIFSTGPRYILPINRTNNLSLSTQYERTDFSKTGTDSERYIVNGSFNHIRNDYVTLSQSNSWSKTDYSGDDNLYRLENAIAVNTQYEHYTGVASLGRTATSFKRAGQSSDDNDLLTYAFSMGRDLNNDSDVLISFSRELTDTSSDINIRNDNASIDYEEQGVVEVTEWSASYNKRFASGTSGSARVYRNKSNYKESLDVERNIGGVVSVSYPIASLLSGFANARYEHSKYSDISQKDDIYAGVIGLRYSLAKNVQLTGDTGYEKKHSNIDSSKYDEWRVSVMISYQPYL